MSESLNTNLKVLTIDVNDIIRNALTSFNDFLIDTGEVSIRNDYNAIFDFIDTKDLNIIINLLSSGMTMLILPNFMEQLEDFDKNGEPFVIHVIDGEEHIGIIDGKYLNW